VAVRLFSLLALVGAVASSVPVTVDASVSINHRLRGVVVAVVAETVPSTSTSGPETLVVETSVFTTVANETVLEPTLELTLTTVPPDVSIGEPAPVPGAVVVAVCSLDAGSDGAWGTADDLYGAPVSAITEPDGTYQLSLVGEACWATVAPPELLTDPDGGEVVLAAVDVSGASTSGQRVVIERAQVDAPVPTTDALDKAPGGNVSSLVLLDASGRTVGSVKGDGVRGLRFATADGSALPTPAASQLAAAPAHQRSKLSDFVLAIAALLALSILLGLVRPRSPREKPLRVA